MRTTATDRPSASYQTQKPLVTGAKPAVEAGQYVEQKSEQAYDATRATAVHRMQTAEHLAQRGYETARMAVAAGARAIEHGADVVDDHVERTYESAREMAGEGVQAVEDAAKEATQRARDAFDSLTHPGSWFDSKSEPAASKPVRLDDPAHPGHAMYQQSRGAVHQVDTAYQRTPDQRSDNLAGALAAKAHDEGMTRVDQVALSESGARAFAVQNGVRMQTAHVQTADAVQTSLAQSSAAWQQVNLRDEKTVLAQQVPPTASQSQQQDLG